MQEEWGWGCPLASVIAAGALPIQRWSANVALCHVLQGAEDPASFPVTASGVRVSETKIRRVVLA